MVPDGVLDEALARVSGLVPDDQLSVVRSLMQDYCRGLQALTGRHAEDQRLAQG
ncbi:MAG: hypothetical protein KGP10_06420 [Actinomycetales bacterium]|nr:hypothetical protein [Actinomycetales bacterium]